MFNFENNNQQEYKRNNNKEQDPLYAKGANKMGFGKTGKYNQNKDMVPHDLLEDQTYTEENDPEKNYIPIEEVVDNENPYEYFEEKEIGLGIASKKNSNLTLEDPYEEETGENDQEQELKKEVLINGQNMEDHGEKYQPIMKKDLNIDFNTAPTGKKQILNMNKNEKKKIGIRPEKTKRKADPFGYKSKMDARNSKTNREFKPWQKNKRQPIDDILGQTG